MSVLNVIVCAPSSFPKRLRRACPNCGGRRLSGYEQMWYSTRWTCLRCGDAYEDGERVERPFQPRWRANAMAYARRVWDEAGRCTAADLARWRHDQMPDVFPAPAVTEEGR